MKSIVYIFIVMLIIASISCDKINDTNRISIELVDKDNLWLGKVICNLPIEFDTLYKWYSTSDCTCCESMNYRSNSKQYKVIKESGFLPNEELDSGFYFTIGHHHEIQCDTQGPPSWDKNPQTKSQILKQNIESFKIDYRKRKQGIIPEVVVDTGRIINSHTYNILYYNELIGQNPFNILSASTVHKKRHIGFKIQSNVHPTDSFYNIAMTVLKSVRIE